MMMRGKLMRPATVGLLCLLCLAGGVLPATAETVPEQTDDQLLVKRLSLEECLHRGIARSSAVEEAQLGIQEMQARSSNARRSRWGTLELSGSYTRLSEADPGSIELPENLGPPLGGQLIELGGSDDDALAFSLQARQPLFTGYKIQSEIAQAELAVHSSREQYRKMVQTTRLQISQAFWDLVEATEVKQVIEKSVERAAALLEEVNSRSKQGMATREDVLRVEMSLEQAKVRQLEYIHSQQLAELQLNLLLSLPESQEIVPEYDFSGAFDVPECYSVDNYAELLSTALQQRPEVQLNRLQQDVQSAELRKISGKWLPNLSLFGQVNYANPNSRQFPPEDEFLLSWKAGITGSVDVGSYKLIGNEQRAAEKVLQQIRRQDEELIRSISLQIKRDLLNLVQTERQMKAAETILAQARENYRIVYDKYRSGAAVNSDVISAQEELLEAQLARSRAHIGCRRSLSRLQYDLGSNNIKMSGAARYVQ